MLGSVLVYIDGYGVDSTVTPRWTNSVFNVSSAFCAIDHNYGFDQRALVRLHHVVTQTDLSSYLPGCAVCAAWIVMHPLIHFHRNYLQQSCEADAPSSGGFPWLSFYNNDQQDPSRVPSSRRRNPRKKPPRDKKRRQHADNYTQLSPGSEPHTPS